MGMYSATPNHFITVITTTVGSAEQAQALAAQAVMQRLAACVQIESIESHYVWQGQTEQSPEWRLVLKTLPLAQERLLDWLRSEHPYELPQLLWRQEQASAEYAGWIAEQLQPPATIPA